MIHLEILETIIHSGVGGFVYISLLVLQSVYLGRTVINSPYLYCILRRTLLLHRFLAVTTNPVSLSTLEHNCA